MYFFNTSLCIFDLFLMWTYQLNSHTSKTNISIEPSHQSYQLISHNRALIAKFKQQSAFIGDIIRHQLPICFSEVNHHLIQPPYFDWITEPLKHDNECGGASCNNRPFGQYPTGHIAVSQIKPLEETLAKFWELLVKGWHTS